MGRRFKPRRRKGRGGLGWIFALASLLAGISAGGAGLAWFLQSRPDMDSATLCPKTGPAQGLVILLDLTDPLSTVQARTLRNLITDRVEQSPEGALIAMTTVQSDAETPFIRCKPLSGETANVLYQNPILLEEQFRDAFADPLNAVLTTALSTGAQAESPLLETLQDVLSRIPRTSSGMDVILVSDLLQNSRTLSVYRGESWTTFVAAGHDQRLSRALSGAKVDIIRLPRPEAPPAAHDAAMTFWARYLDAQGVLAPPRVTVLGDL